jgi:CO/xanthine dehydrogenase Mo-binding subunit
VAPAIGNAIYEALGIRIKDLPITAEKVLRALGKLR